MRDCVRLRSSRKTFNRVRRVHRSAGVDDRFALDRSLVSLVSDYKTWRTGENRVAAVEAAYGCAAVVKPFNRVRRVRRSAWGYDRFALDRSLVLLVSDYKTWRTVENRVAAVERARLRTAAQQSQNHSTACDGYTAVLGLTTASRSIAASCYSSATT